MKILGLKSVVKIGNTKYSVIRIEKKGISLRDVQGRITIYDLTSLEENLANGVMSVV